MLEQIFEKNDDFFVHGRNWVHKDLISIWINLPWGKLVASLGRIARMNENEILDAVVSAGLDDKNQASQRIKNAAEIIAEVAKKSGYNLGPIIKNPSARHNGENYIPEWNPNNIN